LLIKRLFAFAVFSLAASTINILNDNSDIESDKKHPEKSKRPLASGAISKSTAVVFFIGLIVLNSLLLFFGDQYFQGNFWKFTAIIVFYIIMNIDYTFKLKHVAIIEVSIIAIGFVLRVLAGGYATGIYISQWAILLTFVLALVLAIGKRRGELINAQIPGKTRRSLDGYNVQFADIALSISCTLAIVCYLMFTLSPEVQQKFHSRVFYTVIFVVFAFLRYLQQTLVYNKTESPTKIIYKDRYIQITLVLWLAAFLLQIYFK
ncbi:MAG: UbiA prenyltransferase family protein, partial [Kaistella sp.]